MLINLGNLATAVGNLRLKESVRLGVIYKHLRTFIGTANLVIEISHIEEGTPSGEWCVRLVTSGGRGQYCMVGNHPGSAESLGTLQLSAITQSLHTASGHVPLLGRLFNCYVSHIFSFAKAKLSVLIIRQTLEIVKALLHLVRKLGDAFALFLS